MTARVSYDTLLSRWLIFSQDRTQRVRAGGYEGEAGLPVFCQLKFQDPQERWPWVCNHPPDEGPVGCLQSAASVNKAASWHNPARAGVCCAFPVLWTTCPGVVVMGQSVRRLFWLFLGFFFLGGGVGNLSHCFSE